MNFYSSDESYLAKVAGSDKGSRSPSANISSRVNSAGASSKQYTLQKHEFTTECTDNDVLLGRGYAPTLHEGNVRFRTHVATRKDEYVNSKNRNNKSKIAREVAEWVFRNNGKFIKKLELDEVLENGLIGPDEYQCITSSLQSSECSDLNIPSFYELADDETIMDKAKQALRQMEKIPRPSTRASSKHVPTFPHVVTEASESSALSSQKSLSPSSSTSSMTPNLFNPPEMVNLRQPYSSGLRASVSLPQSDRISLSSSPPESVRRSAAPTQILRQNSSDLGVFFNDIQRQPTISGISSIPTTTFDGSNITSNAPYGDEAADLFSGPDGHAFLQKLNDIAAFGNTNLTALSSSYPTNQQMKGHQFTSNTQQMSSLPNSVMNCELQGRQQQTQTSLENEQKLVHIEQQISQLVEFFPNATHDEILSLLQGMRKDEQPDSYMNMPLQNSLTSVIASHPQQNEPNQTFEFQKPALPASSYYDESAASGQIGMTEKSQVLLSSSVDVAQEYNALLLQQQQFLDSSNQSNSSNLSNMRQLRESLIHLSQMQQSDSRAIGSSLEPTNTISDTKNMCPPSIHNQYDSVLPNQRMFQEQELSALPPLQESLNESESELTVFGDDWTDGLPKRGTNHRHKQQFASISDGSMEESMLAYVNTDYLPRLTENSASSGQEFSQKPIFGSRRGSMGTTNRRGSMGSVRRASGTGTSMRSSRTSTYSGMSFQENSIHENDPQYEFSGMDDLMDSFSLMSTDGAYRSSLLHRDHLRSSINTETMGTIENLGNLGEDSSFRTLETHLFSLEGENTEDAPVKLVMLGMENLDAPAEVSTASTAITHNGHSTVVNLTTGDT